MADELLLEVYTPAGMVIQDSASQVTIPSSRGEIGVLPHHIKYTGLIGTGLLEYFSLEENEPRQLVISGGFVNVSEDKVVILADSVDLRDEIDREEYGKKRGEYTEQIANGAFDDPECTYARAQLERIEAIDRLISH